MVFIAVLATVVPADWAGAWHGPGHRVITRLAFELLPGTMPAFFRRGSGEAADAALDPDIFKKPLAQEALHSTEYPDHFIDLELFEGAPLPPTRREFMRQCYERELDPAQIGMVPWAILEHQQRLSICFAEYRRWPDNVQVQARTLIYAGWLAHYAQDLCQPLHTTIHYDGRVQPDGTRRHRGIHRRVDALAGRCDPNTVSLPPLVPIPDDDVWKAILEQLRLSRSRIEPLYQLADQLDEVSESWLPGSPTGRFTRDCVADAALFTARLYEAAWRHSATIRIPDWHQRQVLASPTGDDL